MKYIIMFFLVVLNSYSQVLLKKGANYSGNKSKKILSPYLNKYTLLGYFFFLIITLISLFLLKSIKIKEFSIVLSLNYLVAFIMAIVILKEKFNLYKLIGTLFIVLGVVFLNLD